MYKKTQTIKGLATMCSIAIGIEQPFQFIDPFQQVNYQRGAVEA